MRMASSPGFERFMLPKSRFQYAGKTENCQFGILIPATILRLVMGWCEDSENRETGGLLIGRYAEGQRVALVTEALPAPVDSKVGPTWFVRGIRALNAKLKWRWNSGRGYYLGEWHFHPRGSPVPSSPDCAQMRSISESASYSCPEPVLLIIGGMPPDFDFRSYVFPHRREFMEFIVNDTGMDCSASGAAQTNPSGLLTSASSG